LATRPYYRVCQRLWPSYTKISTRYFCYCFLALSVEKLIIRTKILRHKHMNMARKCVHCIICNFAGMRLCFPAHVFHFIRATIPGTPYMYTPGQHLWISFGIFKSISLISFSSKHRQTSAPISHVLSRHSRKRQ
jgi:hypothetical protein